jgi:uncharacterized protein (TIGR02099 family)
MSLSTVAASTPRRSLRWWRKALQWGAWSLFAAWSLCLVAWLTLHWGILPRLDEWRPRIEAHASQALGAPVQIGRIEVRSSGWVPALELHEVVLRDQRGREALRLPRVAAALSVPSLLALRLRFEQLLIDGARLEVRRDAQGRLHVAGLDVEGEHVGDGQHAADWFFEQHEFVIRGGTLRWVDEQRAAPPLALTDVQLVLRNRGREHDLRLDATPPATWGERFKLLAHARHPLLARAGDWQRWRGTLHADLPSAAVSELRRHVDLPFELAQGQGALRAWIEFDQGLPRVATLDFALRDISARLARDLQPLALARASGRLSAERRTDGVKLVASGLSVLTAEGQAWPQGQLSLSWKQRQPQRASEVTTLHPVTGGELAIEQLDLSMTAQLAERLPLGAGVRQLLAQLSPQGRVSGLNASWQGPLDAPERYQARARVQAMSMAAAASEPGGAGRPGWRGADVDFSANESGGEATLQLNDGALEFPGVFEEPVLPLKRFNAKLQWRIAAAARPDLPPQISLRVDSARFENDDLAGEASARWQTGLGNAASRGGRFPGVLELDGKLTRGQAVRVVRYLPLGLGTTPRDYVKRAVLAGRITQASFRVRGDLAAFPYADGKSGEFRVNGQVQGVTLAYVPPEPGQEPLWPAFSDVSGELLFAGAGMQFREVRGRVWGVQLQGVNGAIRDMGHDPVLEIDGVARGEAADFLRYVAASPVAGWTEHMLDRATIAGTGELKLALRLPLHLDPHAEGKHSVKGSFMVYGGDVRMRPDLPLLAAARGRVDFTQSAVQVAGLQARLFGGDTLIDGGTQADGSLRLNASGFATADGLRGAPELADQARWTARLQGQAAYRAQLHLVGGQHELLLTSPLTGLALDLPPPLRKPPEATWPLRVQTTLLGDARAGTAPARDQLRIELGTVLQAQYQRDLSRPLPQVVRGALSVNAPLPEMVPGVQAQMALGTVDADAWLALNPPPAAGPGPASSSPADYLPRTLQLAAQELTVGGRRLNQVKLGLTRYVSGQEEGWRAQVAADQVRGEIDYREPRGPASAGRVHARLSRLALPKSEVASVENLLERAPASVPALDIQVDDFELRGKKLGRLVVEAVNRGASGVESAREWRLSNLSLQTPEGLLSATGQWGYVPGAPQRRRMAMDFTLAVADSGKLLERLGFGQVVRGGKGLLAGRIGWAGSPLDFDVPTLDGRINIAMDAGQFLKAEPGVGRLLGVLSLQSLPRRLALDFRDVFAEGFAFDNVSGDVTLEHGIARTDNLRLKGVQAAVLMDGSADIHRETQDLRVLVVPEINAGAASLAYAAIHPMVGLGTFLGQWLLRGPLAEANTREFRIGGSWDDPKVVQVERKAGEAPAPPSPPAAAASMPPRNP